MLAAIATVSCGSGDGGGGGGKTDALGADDTPTTLPTAPPTSLDDGEPPSTTPRSYGTVPTPTTSSRAETPIDPSFVPERESLDVDFEEATMNGVAYANAMVMAPSWSGRNSGRVEINAGRAQKRFVGDLGIPDDQKSATVWRVEISLDTSAPIFSTEIRFGETKKIDLDVTNALRIRINVSVITAGGSVAIGNPRFAS